MPDSDVVTMEDLLVIYINGESTLEYDRRKRLPGHQRAYLDKMDEKMDAGIELNQAHLAAPDTMQRAQYVAMHLVNALQNQSDAMAAAMCTYLATRLPDLKQVRAQVQGDEISAELVFEDEQIQSQH